MSSMVREIRQALRGMAKNRGFAALAVTVLALGIGANTALFSVVNAVLLQPLPYVESDRLLQAGRQLPMGRSNAVSITQFLYWRDNNRSFADMLLYDGRGGGTNLVEGDRPERVASIRVSPSFFDVLGATAQLGRSFAPDDGKEGAAKVVIISDGFWRRRFGSDPTVIGRVLRLSGENRTVVGVMARNFTFYTPADLWTPLTLVSDPQDTSAVYYVIGRLAPGATAEAAQADMERVGEQLRGVYPDIMGPREGIFVQPYLEQVVGNLRPALWVLTGAVGLVLLIACANVANLLLARSAGRQREMALRAALGANRVQIVRQLLTESLVLAFAGGALGLVVARTVMASLAVTVPSGLPRFDTVQVDGAVLGFTLAATVLTGILFGLVPALQASRVDLQEALNEGTARAGVGGSRGRIRATLVIAEVAVALALLIGATLLIDSFARVIQIDPGYDYEQVLTLKMSPGQTDGLTTVGMTRFVDQVTERLEAAPGIEAAATISTLPLEHGLMTFFDVEGRADPDATEREGRGQWRLISAGYFRAMGIPLLRGRFFDQHDTPDSQPVVIVNQALVDRYFPDEDPIGQGLLSGDPGSDAPPDRIVGVVGNVSELALDRPPTPTVYNAATQAADETTAFLAKIFPTCWVIRTAGEPSSSGSLVRQEILAVDPEQPVSTLRPMADLMAGSIARRQFTVQLLTAFAGLALALALVGLYGVMSYSVAQRTHEIGVRRALGASRGATLQLVLGQGLRLALVGVAVGVLGALGLSRFLRSLLFETASTDPGVYAVVAAALLLTAAAACLVPALRATRVDPVVALRSD